MITTYKRDIFFSLYRNIFFYNVSWSGSRQAEHLPTEQTVCGVQSGIQCDSPAQLAWIFGARGGTNPAQDVFPPNPALTPAQSPDPTHTPNSTCNHALVTIIDLMLVGIKFGVLTYSLLTFLHKF